MDKFVRRPPHRVKKKKFKVAAAAAPPPPQQGEAPPASVSDLLQQLAAKVPAGAMVEIQAVVQAHRGGEVEEEEAAPPAPAPALAPSMRRGSKRDPVAHEPTKRQQAARFQADVDAAVTAICGGPDMQRKIEAAGDDSYLARVNAHPLDAHIRFVENTHTYFIDGCALDTSATGFIKSFFGGFDAEAIITKMRRGRNWPNPKYMEEDGVTPMSRQAIKDMWAKGGAVASNAGTAMHRWVEFACNAAAAGRPVLIPDVPEGAMFREWLENATTADPDDPAFQPMKHYRTEWCVWSAEHRLAGSIDWVGVDAEGTLHIRDWKHAKACKRKAFGKRGKPPINSVPDCTENHYFLQLNLYAWILRHVYSQRVGTMGLVVMNYKNPECRGPGGTPQYAHIPAPDMQSEVEAMLAHRLARVRPLVIGRNHSGHKRKAGGEVAPPPHAPSAKRERKDGKGAVAGAGGAGAGGAGAGAGAGSGAGAGAGGRTQHAVTVSDPRVAAILRRMDRTARALRHWGSDEEGEEGAEAAVHKDHVTVFTQWAPTPIPPREAPAFADEFLMPPADAGATAQQFAAAWSAAIPTLAARLVEVSAAHARVVPNWDAATCAPRLPHHVLRPLHLAHPSRACALLLGDALPVAPAWGTHASVATGLSVGTLSEGAAQTWGKACREGALHVAGGPDAPMYHRALKWAVQGVLQWNRVPAACSETEVTALAAAWAPVTSAVLAWAVAQHLPIVHIATHAELPALDVPVVATLTDTSVPADVTAALLAAGATTRWNV